MKSPHPDVGRVVIVTTGGTIASRYDASRGAVMSVASGEELLAMLGSLSPRIPVEVREFCNLGSNRIDLDLSFRLAKSIEGVLADDTVAGCVVTHGTATMEESAFLASLVTPIGKPVVFTGSQRAADQPDSDGPRNLADAIRVVAAPEAFGLGVMIVFDGAIYSAVDAIKFHASQLGAFASSGVGPLGKIDMGAVAITRHPIAYPRFPVPAIETRVDLIKLVIGADDRLFRAAIRSGSQGVVLEAFGRGDATPSIVAAVKDATDIGVTTVVTSRCARGSALPLYGDAGGYDLEQAGAIFGGAMRGTKAFVLLCAALPTKPKDQLASLFASFGK